MANEFIHIDPGAILTKAEFELITGHQFNSQATGDILYASDSTQLSRLGIGSNTNVLEITGGLPAWVATSGTGSVARVTSPTFVTPALGTPASGVMTNVSGTASSLTAGTVTTNANLTGHVTSSGNAAVLGSFTSAQLATALSNETGSGAAVFGTSPILVTPALGTPASGVLTNATGLPIAGIANGTDGELITWNASGVAAAVAVGTDTHVLTSNGSGAAPTFQAAPAGAVTREGGNTTEATSTSTGGADLMTITSLSIAAATPITYVANWRKTSGAAGRFDEYGKLNATLIADSIFLSSTTDQAESGVVQVLIAPRVTNYVRGYRVLVGAGVTAAQNIIDSFGGTDMPIATITDVIFRGLIGSSSITMGVDEMQVYSLAVS